MAFAALLGAQGQWSCDRPVTLDRRRESLRILADRHARYMVRYMVRSWKEKDQAARKRAINLAEDPDEPALRKRARQQQMETRVAEERSLIDADIDARYRTLVKPAMELFVTDAIDEVELVRRKKEARAKVAAENDDLAELNAKFEAHSSAVRARAAAEEAEEAAEAELNAVLQHLQGRRGGEQSDAAAGQPGPSGVVKGEA